MTNTSSDTIHHPRAAAFYHWSSSRNASRRFMDPFRAEIVGKARGIVLEVGAGTGLNFSFYSPGQVGRVEAVEPDSTMLRFAQENLAHAKVPITLNQVPAEALPFPDALFDSVVATLVFCSVIDPARGLAEIQRVLKPGGSLLMVEHVRSSNALIARFQDILVPVTTRTMGNCHWNRTTIRSIEHAGFVITAKRGLVGGFTPVVLLEARSG